MEKKQKYFILVFRGLLSLLGFIFCLASLSFADSIPNTSSFQLNNYFIKDSLSASPKEASLAINAINGLSVDPFNGSANFALPLFSPPGRKGIQARLNLNYSTSNPNGSLGFGWRLDIGYIERSLKNGEPSYTTSDEFLMCLNGTTSKLVGIGSNKYRSKTNPGDYDLYFSGGCVWQAKDKFGTVYTFGNSRILQEGPFERKGTQSVFRWYLTKIQDIHGNYMLINYTAGRCGVPSSIYYARNENVSSLAAPQYETFLEFIFEADDRQDPIANLRPGFYLSNAKGRLSQILVWFKEPSGNRLIRKYVFEYQYSTITNRSLLTKISELGSDGATSLPAITFSYQNSVPNYTISRLTNDASSVTYFADFNGDGLTDIGNFYNSQGKMQIRLSTGNGFAPEETWIENFGAGSQLLVGDFNGDARADICAFFRQEWKFCVALSDGKRLLDRGVWLQNTSQVSSQYLYPFVLEASGDNFNDIYIKDIYRAFTRIHSNGSSFLGGSGTGLGYDGLTEFFLGDFDADGLTDACEYDPVSQQKFYIKSMRSSGIIKQGTSYVGFGQGKKVFGLDANNDGLTDAAYYDYENGKLKVRNFTGKAFSEIRELPFIFSLKDSATQAQASDFNGDGLADFVVYSGANMEIAYSSGAFPDLLSNVNNGIGATLSFTYQPSSGYNNMRSDGTPGFPFVIPIFSRACVNDGRGSYYYTTYNYSGGLYDDQEKEFAGFNSCRITQSDGSFSEQYFFQDTLKRGKLYTEMFRDYYGRLYQKKENAWGLRQLLSGLNLVFLDEANSYTYDGDDSFRQTRTRFEYDDYANPTRVYFEGEVGVFGDEKTIVTEYVYNTANWLVAFPCHTYILDANNNNAGEKRFYYDGASSYTLAPTKGLLTKEEAWLFNPVTRDEQWVSQAYEYDLCGNLLKTVDALGRIYRIEYDNKVYTYPVKTINPQGHITFATYDFGTGRVLSAIDANNQTTTYNYDALGRLISVIGPLDTPSLPGATFTYRDSLRPLCLETSKRIYPGSDLTYTTYAYYDGLGRPIETKLPAENDPSNGRYRQIVSDAFKYDFRGMIKEKLTPYFYPSTGCLYTSLSGLNPRFRYYYDCLGRQMQTINPDYSYTRQIYSDWSVKKVDENGNYKIEHFDAYGRITKVEEFNQGQVISTIYAYDCLENLTRIIDNQGNIANFTYDSLGRKVRTEDPDMGTWSYEYDLAGNLVRQTDARGELLEFSYDSLNRLTRKCALAGGQPVELATYVYDDNSKENCLGRLSKVFDRSGSSEYFYDKLGRQIKEIKTVGQENFVVERTYDALGRERSLKYPDGETFTYNYNTQGLRSIVGSSGTEYFKRAEYNACGQPTKLTLGNFVTSYYYYHSRNSRLIYIYSYGMQGLSQYFAYQYDPSGNVFSITDHADYSWRVFYYDNLSRLTLERKSNGTALSYNYDSIGNLTHKEGRDFYYGQAFGVRPHALSSISDGSSFRYDANGNLTEEYMPQRGKARHYYDAENRLIKITPESSEMSFTLYLRPGWNFVSLPVIPKDARILEVLKSLNFGSDYDQVARYNPENKTWEMFRNEPEYDQFNTLEYGRGYQIYVTNPGGVQLTVSGYLSSVPTSIPVSAGWNLVGYPFWQDSKTVEPGLSPLLLGADYSLLERYNADRGAIEKYSGSQKDFLQLNKGEGYFLKAARNTSWLIPEQNAGVGQMVTQTEFVYDAQGARVKKNTPQGLTTYIGGIFEKDSSGTFRKHIFAGSLRICSIITNPANLTSSTIYYLPDHLGSTQVITDSSGRILEKVAYSSFGEHTKTTLNSTNSINSTNYYFTGKELDATTKLYYYGARYYHPSIARFTQPDPLIQKPYDPQNLNRYSYCRNNPIRYIDPTGLSYRDDSSSWSNAWSNWSSTISSFNQNVFNNISNFSSSIGSGFYSFGMSTWKETKIWGSAFAIGVNYSIATYTEAYKEHYRAQMDMQWWTKYSEICNFDTEGPKLQLVYIRIPFTTEYHTYLRISDYPGYNGSWGFNPNSFSLGVPLGISALGRVKSDIGQSFSPIIISNNAEIIRQVYNIAKGTQGSFTTDKLYYVLYGQGKYNCYDWRDQVLRQAGLAVSPWSDE